ncbi:MAG: hypothetical protein LBQ94_06725 [Treponema sp.]|jgi:hypothetical protein|nr:hypothetical protein [Treponema sp.]
MEKCGFDRYASVEAALNEAGFKVDWIEKLANRTVITVSLNEQADAPQVTSEEK